MFLWITDQRSSMTPLFAVQTSCDIVLFHYLDRVLKLFQLHEQTLTCVFSGVTMSGSIGSFGCEPAAQRPPTSVWTLEGHLARQAAGTDSTER